MEHGEDYVGGKERPGNSPSSRSESATGRLFAAIADFEKLLRV
jgi:hypothetical protein